MGRARLAAAISARYGLAEEQIAVYLSQGRFRVKADVDEGTALRFASDLESLGAIVSVVDAATGTIVATSARPSGSFESGLRAAQTGTARQGPALGALEHFDPAGGMPPITLSSLDGSDAGPPAAPVGPAAPAPRGTVMGTGPSIAPAAPAAGYGPSGHGPPGQPPPGYGPPGHGPSGQPPPGYGPPGQPPPGYGPPGYAPPGPRPSSAPPPPAGGRVATPPPPGGRMAAPPATARAAAPPAPAPPPGRQLSTAAGPRGGLSTDPFAPPTEDEDAPLELAAPLPSARPRAQAAPPPEAPGADAPPVPMAPVAASAPVVRSRSAAPQTLAARLAERPRVRILAGAALALVLGYLPAHLYASFTEHRRMDAVLSELRSYQAQELSLDEWSSELPVERQRAVARLRSVRSRVAVESAILWIVASAVVGFVWFRQTEP